MTHDSQHEAEKRDRAIARLAAGELRSEPPSGGGTDTCPEAEVLAAYADRNLDPEQAARCDAHFADCGRCRKILAALVMSADEPLLQQEVQKLGQPVGPLGVPVGIATSKRPAVTPLRQTLRWLGPALGAAAMVLLWFALRPAAPPPNLVSENVPQSNSVSSDVPSADLSTPGEPPPVSTLSNPEVAQGQVLPPTSTFAPQSPGQGLSAPGQAPSGQNPAVDSFSTANAARQEATLPPSVTSAAPVGAADSARAAAATPPPAAPQLQSQAGSTPLSETEKTALPSARSPNAASSGLLGSQQLALSQTVRTSGPLMPAPEKKVAPTFTFSSPGGVQWRGGTSGLIERSTDQGRTWQAQASGVMLDLAAGSAASNQIAWIVGHAGVILHTTDGVTWQRVVSPNAAITDWTSVAVNDAQHVTIVSKDQHRFTTNDGGQIWTPQP